MKRLSVAAWLFLAACTATNPAYGPASIDAAAGRVRDQGVSRPDLAAADLGAPGACALGERSCGATVDGTPQSERCVEGDYHPDRTCPGASTCASGYCQPPLFRGMVLGKSCDSSGAAEENLCLGVDGAQPLSCEPFVTDPARKQVSWFCDQPVGAGLAGVPCTRGSDCRSGICAADGICFRGCKTTSDCLQPGTLTCSVVTLTVEGVRLTASSCIPL